jgi:hypothetical protein
MRKLLIFSFCVFLFFNSNLILAQKDSIKIIKSLKEIQDLENGIYKYWLEVGSNTFGNPILVPIILFQGASKGKTLGLTAAIHGNELNGISIIHELTEKINTKQLAGRIIAIPGLNVISVQLDQRIFYDNADLNRSFPGNENGNRNEQYANKITKNILPAFDIHIDMHTASFGRVNSMYVRADLENDTLKSLAKLQQPDIILNSKAVPSSGVISNSARILRAEATLQGIASITVEYGNPQVYQKEIVLRGVNGILRTLDWLKMYKMQINTNITNIKPIVYCQKSYWIYMDEGGFLEVLVDLKDELRKGDKIAIVRDAFGKIISQYFAPENGIVIGKSSNPANMSGGRILFLGIL